MAVGARTQANDAEHRIHLSGGGDAASGARAAVDLLTLDLFGEVGREDVRLMVSELVANSVRHGGAPNWTDHIELSVYVTETALRVECSDPLAGFDVPPAPSGYGLAIVEALSSHWGVRYGQLGSTWFEYARAG
jgi:anti-sigma regulatory factor (Ser/Thr protein kinase)